MDGFGEKNKLERLYHLNISNDMGFQWEVMVPLELSNGGVTMERDGTTSGPFSWVCVLIVQLLLYSGI